MSITTSPPLVANGTRIEPYRDIQRRTPVSIDQDLCTGCQLCTQACPQSVLKSIADPSRLSGLVAVVYNPALCTACRQCEDVCPDFCITVREGR